MKKEHQASPGGGSRAGAIIYIVVSIVSVWFFYWFGNIGGGTYGSH